MLACSLQGSSRKIEEIRIKGAIVKTPLISKKTAYLIAGLAADKKAQDVVILDMRKAANFCDYFVVCSGTSDRQVHSIARAIEDGLEKKNIHVRRKEGFQSSLWVLLDLGDVVTHVFEAQAREFYGLEYLWHDAKKVNWRKK